MTIAVQDFHKQHLNNYKKAVIEILKNNTKVLFDEDIMSLIKNPPLDSMDLIKKKFLSLAKKQKIVLDTENLEKILSKYRKELSKEISPLKEKRIELFKSKVNSFEPKSNGDTIKFNKKDFLELNKNQKKEFKEYIDDNIDKNIVKNVNKVFTQKTSNKEKEKFSEDMEKYLTKKYSKQLLEDIEFKVLVKDTTLINGVREQGEKYIFTRTNSYLLDKKPEIKSKAR